MNTKILELDEIEEAEDIFKESENQSTYYLNSDGSNSK